MNNRLLLHLLLNLLFLSTVPAQAATYALLVGVGEYDDPKVPDLPFIDNDVTNLEATLSRYGGIESERIVKLHDNSVQYPPTKSMVEEQVPLLVQALKPEDTIIIFFSGHGVNGRDGKLYLCPKDARVEDIESTCIAASWLRDQIRAASAGTKIFLFDSCHAGNTKDILPFEASDATSTAKSIVSNKGEIFTIASCKANEKSQIWQQMRQSLFSYWLIQGLRGHANANQDDFIDTDELYAYVNEHVTHSAKVWLDKQQSPVRISAEVSGVPKVIKLSPQPLQTVIADLAEAAAWNIAENQKQNVGIIAFTSVGPGGEFFSGPYGQLAFTCTKDVEKSILNFIGKRRLQIDVVSDRVLANVLREVGFSVEDLGNREKLRAIGEKTGADVLVTGSFRSREKNIFTLDLRADDLEGRKVGATMSGVAKASPNIMGEIAISADTRKAAQATTSLEVPVLPSTSPADLISQEIAEHESKDHPMLDRDFPFRAWIEVDGKFSRGKICKNDRNKWFIPIPQGKRFVVRAKNKSDKMVLVKILADGFSTLPSFDGEPMPREHLADARAYYLTPDNDRFSIEGFLTDLESKKGKLKYFMLGDVSESYANRRKYTEQLGIISVAFYEAVPSKRGGGVGIVDGGDGVTEIEYLKGFTPGNLLSVLHLRYYDAAGEAPCD